MQHLGCRAQRVSDRGRWNTNVELDDFDIALELGLVQFVEEGTGRVLRWGWVRVMDERADSLAALDIALVGEIGQGAAHRDPRHSELLNQGLFGRQQHTLGKGAAGDLVAQDQEELPV